MYKFLFLIIFLSQSVFATLPPDQQTLVRLIQEDYPSQVKILTKLVNMHSGTTSIKGVHAVGESIRPYFEALGFKTRWVEEPASMKRGGTLIAEKKNGQGKRLLLIGHLDTVFTQDTPFKTVTLKSDIATGPGVLDDKGGIVVLLSSLKALKKIGALDHANITVVLTGDEEDSGKPTSISRKPLIDIAKNTDVALDFEPGISTTTATLARRGISHWMIESHGQESHSASIFTDEVGAGAIFESARILNTMREHFQGDKNLSFNPGIYYGGNQVHYQPEKSAASVVGKTNVVSKVAIVKGDFRFIDTAQREAFKQQLRSIVDSHLPGTSSTVSFQDGIPAMALKEGNQQLLNLYNQVSLDLDLGNVTMVAPNLRGAADISYVSDYVKQNLSGLGPIGSGMHTVKETLLLSSLITQSKRAALLIYRLIN